MYYTANTVKLLQKNINEPRIRISVKRPEYNRLSFQTVNHAPTNILATTLPRPVSTDFVKPKEWAPIAAFDVL